MDAGLLQQHQHPFSLLRWSLRQAAASSLTQYLQSNRKNESIIGYFVHLKMISTLAKQKKTF